MQKHIHILMTGAGAPGAPGIIRCLKKDDRIKLTVGDADAEATGRYLADDFVQLLRADEPAFIDSLIEVCEQRKIDLVLPLVTRELVPLAVAKSRFESKNIRVLVSREGALQIANNKASCYKFLQEKGIDLPRFFVVSTAEQFIHAAFELGHPQRSFCFKPSVSNGSRGFRIVSDSLNESDILFHQKPYNTQITYTHALKILSSQAFPELLVTDFVGGEEYSVDCLAKDGNLITALPRLREKMTNGISVKGRFVNDDVIVKYCEQIINAIGLHGNIGIQVRLDANQKPLLLEINPRVQGTIVAALGAGVNLPLLAVQQELNEPGFSIPKPRWGIGFSRFWDEVFY